jgi:type III pantothenate kinase
MMSRSCFIDVGNSRIKLWLCDGQRVIARYAVAHQYSPDILISGLPLEFYGDVDFIGVSSVLADHVNRQLEEICQSLWRCIPHFAVTDYSTLGVTCAYADPALLGIDRWLNILAVAGRQPACVVSCGTALTIDVVNNNQHCGGYILPGMNLQLSSLIHGTQRVRPHDITCATLDYGKNTSESVHHGILLACTAAIEKVHAALKQVTDKNVQLILTGGDAEKLSPHLQIAHDMMPELLLLGLQRYFGHSS